MSRDIPIPNCWLWSSLSSSSTSALASCWIKTMATENKCRHQMINIPPVWTTELMKNSFPSTECNSSTWWYVSHERGLPFKNSFSFDYLIRMIILSWPWRVSFIFCSRYSILLFQRQQQQQQKREQTTVVGAKFPCRSLLVAVICLCAWHSIFPDT